MGHYVRLLRPPPWAVVGASVAVCAQALLGSSASVQAFLGSLRCRVCPMPRKIREKKFPELKDRTEEFQDWFLLQSPCRLERREPSRKSGDPEERKWANWIHDVRYASSITAANISVLVDWLFQSCGCVRKGIKRFFPEDPSCPALVEDLTRKSAIRRRKKGLVDDGLLTTTTQDLSGPRLTRSPDMIGKFDLSTPYDD